MIIITEKILYTYLPKAKFVVVLKEVDKVISFYQQTKNI